MRKAFTAVEILVAITLFTVGLLSLIQVIPANRKLLTQSASLTQATFLAGEQLESLRARPFSELTPGIMLSRSAIESAPSSPYAAFERQVEVAHIGQGQQVSATETGLKRVLVTVYWVENSVQRQYQLASFVTAATTGAVRATETQVLPNP